MTFMSRSRNGKHRNGPQKSRTPPAPLLRPEARRELTVILLAVAAVILAMSFAGAAGKFGAGVDGLLATLFGLNKYFLPVIALAAAAHVAKPEKYGLTVAARFGLLFFLLACGGLINILVIQPQQAADLQDLAWIARAGGLFGLTVAYPVYWATSFWASVVILTTLTIAAIVLIFNLSLRELAGRLVSACRLRWLSSRRPPAGPIEPPPDIHHKQLDQPQFKTPTAGIAAEKPAADKDSQAMNAAVRRKSHKPVSVPLDLLEHRTAKPSAGDINGRMSVIRKCLENFGIPVEMGEVSVGPTVTQFTLRPAEGIKLARITSLNNDLAMALAAHPIRIEAPIPGKPLVGIEVPNQTVAIVGLREILESREFSQRRTSLTICLGKDVSGKPWVADLGKMPHLLVAGATGSGKTVCLNTIILSLLCQNHPDDLKLMLIDPKRVELPVYNGIPHLITPAITEIPKIINALKWTLGEMDRRFELLSQNGKRDIGAYNETAAEKMPYIVVIIDELADLMVASASEVEASIIRLAQMARAVGIHLVVATQRPSVDIITGLIKANITSRIAFSVASATDSRTILDTSGAEKLVGRGDSLFQTPELSKPKRIQCCYVSDGDIRRVVDHVIGQLDEPVEYEEGITEKNSGAGPHDFGYNAEGDDDLLDEAQQTILKAGKASASYLQRRLKIGYARAARLLDLLEERGIIGPGDGAKPRQILVSPISDEDGLHVTEPEEENDEKA